MKKALTSVLLSLILTLTASGCAPELYERLLISAIGVDRTATGCRVTVLASETTEDGGQSTFSGEGDTVPEALSQIALESGRTPLYSHNAAILFGMQCAESGIAEQLDFFIRHYDSRPTAKVFLAEDTAESVLLQRDLTAERFMQLSNGAKYSEAAADAIRKMTKQLPGARLKSKVVRPGSIELTMELRLKENETGFVEKFTRVEGVYDASLITHQGDIVA